MLGISLEEQKRLRDPRAALRRWTEAVEQSGVLVFQSGLRREWVVDVTEMRGFALTDSYAPTVALNGGDAHVGRVFTLIHEVAHLALGEPGISGVPVYLQVAESLRAASAKVEAYCNRVAAEVLVPLLDLTDAAGNLQLTADRGPATSTVEQTIARLAKTFAVSREVIARRLCDAGLVTIEFYREQRSRLQRGSTDAAPSEERTARRGGPSPAVVAVSRHGRAFTRLVLSAWASERVSAGELQDLLGANLRHLPRIEELAYKSAERGNA